MVNEYTIINLLLNFTVKKLPLLIFFIVCNKSFAQKSYDIGKEIGNIEQYNFKEIDFLDSENNTKLSGTLIFPKTEYSKIAIIIPGSGKDTRNSHYVLVEELLKNGIAVYRFDDRGVGKSGGIVNFSVDQIITDLYYAFDNIKKIDTLSKKSIGLIGHSLGGIATIDNYQKGIHPNFIVLMATPIEKYGNFNHSQFQSGSNPKIKVSAKTLFESINIPLLFISGTNDSFFNSIKTAELLNSLNNSNIEIKTIKGLNHFLKVGNDDWKKTKKYDLLYEIDASALSEIVLWLKKI